MIKEEVVKLYLDSGFNVMPVQVNKRPTGEWSNLQKQRVVPQEWKADNLAVICGEISGNLEVIDLDQKYALKGNILKELSVIVTMHSKDLWDKLTIQSTVSGGWHLIYRCSKISGNQKLAMRYTTEAEKKQDPHEKVKVLLETRGEGGYILSYPSNGYKMISGKWSNVKEITPMERMLLMSCCKSFDETTDQFLPKYDTGGTPPWEEYNEKHKCEDVLSEFGWTVVGNDSKRVFVKRPGKSDARDSGNILIESNIFKCWSSSTEFDLDTAYNPSAIYCVLKHGGDWKEAARDMFAQGYGERPKLETLSDVSSFVVSRQSISAISDSYNRGELQKSRGLGIPSLDKFLVFRENAFYTVTGGKGTGKTSTMLYIYTLDAYCSGAKTMMVMYENDAFEAEQEVIGFLTGTNAKWLYKENKPRYDAAADFFHEHFAVLKIPKEYNIYQIFEVAAQLNSTSKYNRLFIDPLFKVPETDDYSKNKKIAASLEPFASDVMSVYVSMHPTGRSQREGGRPKDLDAEFGGVYSNAADITFVFYRDYKSDDEQTRTTVEMSIDKMRSKKIYGGSETFKDNPIKFQYQWKKNGYRIWVPSYDTMNTYEMIDKPFEEIKKNSTLR